MSSINHSGDSQEDGSATTTSYGTPTPSSVSYFPPNYVVLMLVIIGAIGVYQLYYAMVVGYYVNKNYHRSLEYAILREQEWQRNKPADDDDDDLFGDDDEEDDEEGADDGEDDE